MIENDTIGECHYLLMCVLIVLRKAVKNEWDNQKSIRFNMESMGLSFDSNKSVSKGRANVS